MRIALKNTLAVMAIAAMAACAPKTLSPAKPTIVDINAANGLALLQRAEGGGANLGEMMATYANRCLAGAFPYPVTADALVEVNGSQQQRGFYLYRATAEGALPPEDQLVNNGTDKEPGNLLYVGAINFAPNTETIFEQGIGTLPGVQKAQRVFRRTRPVSDDYSDRGCP